jgi:hypothetical protein
MKRAGRACRRAKSNPVEVRHGKEEKMNIELENGFALFAALSVNTNWRSLTPQQLQVGIGDDPKGAGREFEAFIRNGFRMQIESFFRYMEDLTIEIPARPRPTLAELRERWSWIREKEGIERDTSTEDPVVLRLGTVLRPDEPKIDGPEYKRRMINVPSLGLQHSDWVVQHQNDDTPAFAALRALKGKIYIDFRGLVVVSEDGDRSCPCVSDGGEQFVQGWYWTVGGLDQDGRVAVPGK